MLLSIENVINRMIQVYRVHWASMLRYIGLMLALGLLFIILLVVGVITVIGVSVSSTDPESLRNFFTAISGPFILFIILLFVVMIVLNVWLQIAFTRATSRAVLNHEKISIGSELKESRPLIWRTLGVGILVGLIAIFPFLIALGGWLILRLNEYFGAGPAVVSSLKLLLVLIGVYGFFHMIYFSITLCFSQIAVSVNGLGIKESLQKSAQWVRGKWWAIFGRLFCAGLILVVPYYVFSGLGYFQNFIGIFFNLVTVVYYIGILLPMSMIPSVLLYHNLKGDLPAHGPHQK